MIKTAAISLRCHILRLKCTKLDFGWSSVPVPTVGAYSSPPDPLAELQGSYFYVQEGKEKEGTWDGREGMGREEEREGRKWEKRERNGKKGKLP